MRRERVTIICDICLADMGEEIEGERLVLVIPELGVRQLDVCADYHGALAGELNELAHKYGRFTASHVTHNGRLMLNPPATRAPAKSRAHDPGGAWEPTEDGNYRCLVETDVDGVCRREYSASAGLKKHQSIVHGLEVVREERPGIHLADQAPRHRGGWRRELEDQDRGYQPAHRGAGERGHDTAHTG